MIVVGALRGTREDEDGRVRRPAVSFASVMTRKAESMPPLWSRCQWLRWIRETVCKAGERRAALAVQIDSVGPVSKRRVWGTVLVVPVCVGSEPRLVDECANVDLQSVGRRNTR